LPQAFSKVGATGSTRCAAWIEHADAVNLPRLLRLSGERLAKESGERRKQEVAAVHATPYSIT
jgi:hypothetical protein